MTTAGTDVLVIGGGPAGVFAALRAADLGARTTLVTSGEFGGMAATDGPVPVRALAQAARLMREAGQLPRYGVGTGAMELDYRVLLDRVREVVEQVRSHSSFRNELERAGTTIHENVGRCRFVGKRTIESPSGQRFDADKIVLCTGGQPRRLDVPGFEHVVTHSGAWTLNAVPESMLVIGGGATGLQVASIFAAFGTKVTLFEAGSRLLRTEDDDVAGVITAAFRNRGIVVREAFGSIDRFEPLENGIRMYLSRTGGEEFVDASVAVCAVGWCVDAERLELSTADIETDEHGFVRIDAHGLTSAPDIYAAGDVTGGTMFAPQAIQQGFIAASAALRSPELATGRHLVVVGSFTDPEYARVGMTEGEARGNADAISVSVPYETATRPIIDGCTIGFCKLTVDRSSRRILGCSVVGERAVDITQIAAVAMEADMRVDQLAGFSFAFPVYAGLIWQAAARLTYQLNVRIDATMKGCSTRAPPDVR